MQIQSSSLLTVYQTLNFTSSMHQFYLFICSTILLHYVFVERKQIKVLNVIILNRGLDKMINDIYSLNEQ